MKGNSMIKTHESQVVLSSDVPLHELFSTEKKSEGISDDDRKLMDDLQITPDSVRNKKVDSRCSRTVNDQNSFIFTGSCSCECFHR